MVRPGRGRAKARGDARRLPADLRRVAASITNGLTVEPEEPAIGGVFAAFKRLFGSLGWPCPRRAAWSQGRCPRSYHRTKREERPRGSTHAACIARGLAWMEVAHRSVCHSVGWSVHQLDIETLQDGAQRPRSRRFVACAWHRPGPSLDLCAGLVCAQKGTQTAREPSDDGFAGPRGQVRSGFGF